MYSITKKVKITKKGSITIPKEIREEMKLEPKKEFLLSVDNKGKITLNPTLKMCVFCRSTDDLTRNINDHSLCEPCYQYLITGGDLS